MRDINIIQYLQIMAEVSFDEPSQDTGGLDFMHGVAFNSYDALDNACEELGMFGHDGVAHEYYLGHHDDAADGGATTVNSADASSHRDDAADGAATTINSSHDSSPSNATNPQPSPRTMQDVQAQAIGGVHTPGDIESVVEGGGEVISEYELRKGYAPGTVNGLLCVPPASIDHEDQALFMAFDVMMKNRDSIAVQSMLRLFLCRDSL